MGKGRPPLARQRATVRASDLRSRAQSAARYTRAHRPRRPRRRLAIGSLLRAAALGVLLGAAIVLLEQGAATAASLVAGVMENVARVTAPAPVPDRGARTTQPLPENPAAAPVVDALEPFTRESRLVVTGRLPSYLLASGERPRVEIVVNGTLAASPATDERGRFSATVALAPGPNVITAVTIRADDRVEGRPQRVVLDTIAPPLVLAQPAEGASLEGPTVRVEGRTETGASVAVNGHAVTVTADGGFEDVLQAQPGAFAVEVVARDPAGNETKRRISVTVKESATATGATLTVGVRLDRTKVQPAQEVAADITVSDRNGPLRETNVTVSVELGVVGSGRTDASGRFRVSFKAPSTEGVVQVVALATAQGASGRGAAQLEVVKQ